MHPAASAEPALVRICARMRAHKLLVAATTVGFLLLAIFWLGFVRTPSYEATANLLVTPLPQDDETFRGLQLLRDSGDPTRTVQTASSVVESLEAARRTAQVLGPGWSTQRVKDSVSIAPEGESNILAVTGTAGDAGARRKLANTFTRQTLAVRRDALERAVGPLLDQLDARQRRSARLTPQAAAELEDRINQLENVRTGNDPTLSISEPAEAPTSPSGAGPAGDPRAGLLRRTGARVGGGGAARGARPAHPGRGRGAVDPPVADPRARALPAGARLARRLPTRRGRWRPSCARRAARSCSSCRPHHEGGRVLMVTSASTGDGKTTSAINLAATLAGLGRAGHPARPGPQEGGRGQRLAVPEPVHLNELLSPDLTSYPLLRTAPSLPSVSVLATELLQGDAILLDPLYARLPQPRRGGARASPIT